jgi:hypothetical protein
VEEEEVEEEVERRAHLQVVMGRSKPAVLLNHCGTWKLVCIAQTNTSGTFILPSM